MTVKKKLVAPADHKAISIGLRRFLYFSAAITGAAIMIIEILGAKMLAPYLGTSHFVWTAQIAVTLVALAAGYYVGGRVVDYSPKLNHIYACILGAAIYLAFTLIVVEKVAFASLRFNLPLGSLLTSLFLFFIPLSLLAMVGPFMIRMLTVSFQGLGSSVGRLTAVSTLGSFAGTVLIGYILIPYLPNSITMVITAGGLMALTVAYFTIWEARLMLKPVFLCGLGALFLFGCGGIQKHSGSKFSKAEEIYRANSNFGLMQVLQVRGGTQLFFLNDYLTQNTYDTATGQSTSMFTYMLHDLARAYTPRIDRALCIGMGVGIVPMQLAQAGVEVDVVEINPAVLPVATQFFGCDLSQFNLHIEDGRYFINRTEKQYDTIILDAFLGDSSPSHLMSREAFASMRNRLTAEGTLVINSFGDFERGRDLFSASLHRTLREVFPSVKIHASGNGNIFFVASRQPNLEKLHSPGVAHLHPSCREDAARAFATLIHFGPEQGLVLRDDYNPIDFYDAANREQFRRQWAQFMRSL
jgi:spermidine synthase